MKVGIAGVSSVGKTTLAKAVAAKVNLPCIVDTDMHEAAFAYMEDKDQKPSTRYFPNMTPEEHINFERAYVVIRKEMEEKLVDFVGDETPLDILNYYYHVCAPHPEIMSPEEFESVRDQLKASCATYDIIWYITPGQIPIVDDNRRFTNKHLLDGWDFTLRGLIGENCDGPKPVMGFITDVPELDKRIEVVSNSIEIVRQMNLARSLLN